MAHRNVAKSRNAAAANLRDMNTAPSPALLAVAALTTRHFATATDMIAATLQVASQVLVSRTIFLARFDAVIAKPATQRTLTIVQVLSQEDGCHLQPGKADTLLQTYGETIRATVAPLVIVDVAAADDHALRGFFDDVQRDLLILRHGPLFILRL